MDLSELVILIIFAWKERNLEVLPSNYTVQELMTLTILVLRDHDTKASTKRANSGTHKQIRPDVTVIYSM